MYEGGMTRLPVILLAALVALVPLTSPPAQDPAGAAPPPGAGAGTGIDSRPGVEERVELNFVLIYQLRFLFLQLVQFFLLKSQR